MTTDRPDDRADAIEAAACAAQDEHQVAAYGQSSVDGWFCKAHGCNWEASGNAASEAKAHVAKAIAAAAVEAAGLLSTPADQDNGVAWERDQYRKANERLSEQRDRLTIDLARVVDRTYRAEAELANVKAEKRELKDVIDELRAQIERAQQGREMAVDQAKYVEVERDKLRALIARIREHAFEHNQCSGCQTPWWLRSDLDAAPLDTAGGEQHGE